MEVVVDVVVVVVDVDVLVVVVVVVVVVHFTSHSFSSDPSESLHSVPLATGSWTMVRFLRIKPFPHQAPPMSQSDHVDH